MNPTAVRISLFLFLLLLAGCLGPVRELYPEQDRERPISVYVVRHGWHVGLAFKSHHLTEFLPGHGRFPNTKFLMVGWGDDKYYTADKGRVDYFMRAAFWPTASVLQVVGFNRAPPDYWVGGDMVRVRVSPKGMEKMCRYLAGQFRRNGEGNLVYATEGHYPVSAFYEARGKYFFPRTSNRWTARTLRQSGFPITPLYAFTSANVMRQAGKSGEVIRIP